MTNKTETTWNYGKIGYINPINRKDAKYYSKHCTICKEYFDSNEKLFEIFIRTYKTEEDYIKGTTNFTIDNHIFTQDALNEKLGKFKVSH